MKNRNLKIGTGHSRGMWPVLLVLLLAVLVPTACVLWFMNAAIRNERLAVTQKLVDVYRKELLQITERVDEEWANRFAEAEKLHKHSPVSAFQQIIQKGLADSAIIYDKTGAAVYPTISKAELIEKPTGPGWVEAHKLEYELNKPAKAAEFYAKILKANKTPNIQALAIQAQVRCLTKAAQRDKAIQLLRETFDKNEKKYREATDSQGRLIVANLLLLATQLSEPEQSKNLIQKLKQIISDYTNNMPSAQRRFLITEFLNIDIGKPHDESLARMLAAEELAERYLSNPKNSKGIYESEVVYKQFTSAKIGLMMHAVADDKGRIVLLLKNPPTLESSKWIAELPQEQGAILTLRQRDMDKAFAKVPYSSYIADYKIAVMLLDDNPLVVAATKQNAVYRWVGVLGILAIALLAVLAAHYVGRQMKLTRLKNDFIATVSHELKTPLASMRVLVDTLLEGRCADEQQANEYFQLIARENARLTRLIDNFLTFSRMERNKRAFQFEDIAPKEIVETAIDSIGERLSNGHCKLDVEVAAELPNIFADKDAMVTVLINLLDNGLKYSEEPKEISIRAFAEDGQMCFAVGDNGIGMDRKAVRKIFNRFYQVDQTLSRSGSGCGLGLSIVKFILDAHGGQIDVKSQLGKGSEFVAKVSTNGLKHNKPEGNAK